ncbi:MAG: hypothetical protein B7W98_03155 [Parcubacteria group bacterium 20-58-5]|nr:MAG: hypothetical protein B7W98_03155 [Parcubacteria group bacterium 20-58-5]
MPPSIPTSFVPHPSEGRAAERAGLSIGVIALGSYIVLALVVFGAIGVFVYGRILAAQLSSQDAALAKAHASIDAATVDSFVRLQNRLSSGKQLLDSHVALSGFFTALGTILPSTVRFNALSIAIDDKGVASLSGSGTAKTFNALAAASSAFASDGRIKDAIFSNIQVQQGGKGVSFALTATLDPSLITYTPSAPAAAPAALAPSGSGTAATTTTP